MSRLAIVGAAGRMGQRVIARLPSHPQVVGATALVRDTESAGEGFPASLRVTADTEEAFSDVEVAIDFTAPPACGVTLPTCARRGVAYVLASTGMSHEQEAAIAGAAEKVPVLVAANFSIGVNLMLMLTELCAARLGATFDIEIHELHHRRKRDAPSGTALALAEAVEAARGPMTRVLGRQGAEGPRGAGELGISAGRGGDVVGEHTVYFFGEGERLELTHRATTPDIFADGALVAARWLVGKPPGRYSMRDVLGELS